MILYVENSTDYTHTHTHTHTLLELMKEFSKVPEYKMNRLVFYILTINNPKEILRKTST